MQRGWSVVELDIHGWPLRARYGNLPGRLQTVGRAERYAALMAIKVAKRLSMIVVDLKSLEVEGNAWSEQHAAATATHATLWRQIFAEQETKDVKPPKFQWVPAHLSWADAMDKGVGAREWLLNQWADFFAKLGALGVRATEANIEEAKVTLNKTGEGQVLGMGHLPDRSVRQMGRLGRAREGDQATATRTTAYSSEADIP